MKKSYSPHSKTSETQKENRKKLLELFHNTPMPADELLINTGLYTRSSALAKQLFLNEIYEKIIPVPGNVMVFGTWWGQDVVTLYNLRAIHEPYNYSRKVIGFDTFSGYPGISGKDKLSDTIKKGAYNTAAGYENYLDELMQYHEKENSMGHIRKFDLVKGDINRSLPAYMRKNSHQIIALIYIDVALYEPTKTILIQCIPHLVKGSVIVFDELNAAEYPGETIALKESRLLERCIVMKSNFLPDRTLLVYR